MKKTHSKSVWEPSLNTLAQNGTDYNSNPSVIITGNGTELGNDKTLKGRAKRKVISVAMAFHLIRIAESKGDFEKMKSFWNTYHCQNRVYSVDGRLYGKYCKNRYCTLCCSIRKAEIINKYFPVLKDWGTPYFVTLTVKSCDAKTLKKLLKKMFRGFRRIISKYRKRHQRGTGCKLMGVKSLESNFNHTTKEYNPHFHIIVASKEMGEILIAEWLKLWTPKFALPKCQDMRKVHNLESGLIEIIKYGSKIFTEPDIKNRSQNRDNSRIHAAALYNIFEAMEGLRIFERFGFDLPPGQRVRKGAQVAYKYGEWVFVPRNFDWLNVDNELTLSGYSPPHELVDMLRYNVNRELE